MLPSSDPKGDRTARQMVGYSLAMIAFSVVPVFLGLSDWAFMAGALLLGSWFMVHVGRFWFARTVQHARAVLKASVLYIPLLLLAIILDRLFLMM